MAQVDFSNAHIAPYDKNPIGTYNTGFATVTSFRDSGGNTITNTVSLTTLKNESAEAIYRFTGSFSASGTEFYFGYASSYICWRVTNVTFSSGDTFDFSVKLNII